MARSDTEPEDTATHRFDAEAKSITDSTGQSWLGWNNLAEEFPQLVVRNSADLADAFSAIKSHLGLSNELCEELGLLARGHIDKALGRPPREKRIGPMLFDTLCELFAVEWVPRVNPEALKRMERRWEKRDQAQVRVIHDVSEAMLTLCRPLILAEMGRRGAEATNKLLAQRRRHARRDHATR